MKTLKPRARFTASRTAMAASQVWGQRAGHVFLPVEGLEGPDAPVHGLPATLHLEADAGTVLEPDAEVQLGGLRGRRQFVDDLAGVAALCKLVVDRGLAVAFGVVLASVWGKLRLYVHLMMPLFEIFDDWPVRV